MKIQMEKLRALAALPDDALWREARRMASGFGFALSETVPPHEDLERLRDMVRTGERIRLSDAARIVEQYRDKSGRRER